MPLRTTPTMDYHIHDDYVESFSGSNRTRQSDEEALKVTSDSSPDKPILGNSSNATVVIDLDMDGTKKSRLSAPSWLSSWKIWLVLAVTVVATIVVVIVALSPKKQRQIDQYASNHGIKKLLENKTVVSKTYCDNSDAFTNTTNDDGIGCSGTCYVEFRNILVPSEGYNNGCNTCYCDPSSATGFKCTMNPNCTSSGICQYNGWYYQPGDVVPHAASDSCNTCKCQKYYNETRANLMASQQNETDYNENDFYDYRVVCTTYSECNKCSFEGQVYDIGQSFVGGGCPSNICSCNSSNNVTCTNLNDNGNGDDDMEEGEGGGGHNSNDQNCEGYCTWEGYAYETYQCFTSIDGKNKCTCLDDGNVVCTDCDNLIHDI